MLNFFIGFAFFEAGAFFGFFVAALLNAAHALNLGSCWINRAREMFDTPEGKALLKQWGVPEKYRGIGCCILGYAAEEPAPKPRLDGRIWKI